MTILEEVLVKLRDIRTALQFGQIDATKVAQLLEEIIDQLDPMRQPKPVRPVGQPSRTTAELYNSILRAMKAQGKSEEEIRLVGEYLTGKKVNQWP